MTGTTIAATLTGTAVVCCVHDQVKRAVTDLAYDPVRSSPHVCACCENMFLEPSDRPLFCPACRQPPTHQLAGPLPNPSGRA